MEPRFSHWPRNACKDERSKPNGSDYDSAGYERPQTNSPEDVLEEIGLFLVIVLGAIVAINAILLALHIG